MDTIFFSWWRANTPYRFLVSVAIVYVLPFVFEGMNNIRSQFESSLNKKITVDNYR